MQSGALWLDLVSKSTIVYYKKNNDYSYTHMV